MIRAEKHEVESIAASCATGLERAWAENDLLRRDLTAALDTVESLSQQLDARPANTRIVWLAVAGGLGLWLGLVL